MIDNNIKAAMWTALIAIIIDQLYHIVRGYSHQIFDLFGEGTIYYISIKFFFVFIVSLIIFSSRIEGRFTKSATIGIIAAYLFSIVLTYLFPGVYGTGMHMLHAAAIFAGAWAVLKYNLGGKTMANKIKISTIVLAIIGWFYAFMPHTIHLSSRLDFGLSHSVHITVGVAALILAYWDYQKK